MRETFRKYGIMLMVVLLVGVLSMPVFAAELSADGQYTIEVLLSGGSGRATVESPATLTVTGQQATAHIVWSSPYYEFMLVDGQEYLPVNTEGNAAFDIPVVLDADMPVSAQTIAMSEPHLVDYVLYFDSSTIAPVGAASVGLGSIVLIVAAVLVVAVVVVLLRRRKGRGA